MCLTFELMGRDMIDANEPLLNEVHSSDELGGVEPEHDDDRPIWEELDDDAWAEDDEPREPPEFGCCLPPGECCMPGLHFPSECHTAADYEREQFGGWASDAGPRKTPNVGAERTAAPNDPERGQP